MSDEIYNLTEPSKDQLTYGSYLKINDLLDLQIPLSPNREHDETLFIIIHQVYELWFKQILHEVAQANQMIDQDKVMPFFRALKRINTIQDILTQQIDILETMTPNDFNRFRERLNPASGFQSVQFRVVEFLLGGKSPAYTKFHKHDPEGTAALEKALASPTLYDHFLRYLRRHDHAIPDEVINRDVSQLYKGNDQVTACLLKIYKNCDDHYEVYLVLEALADLDQKFMLWRYRHVAMVSRMIGSLKGTGGSSGVKYLNSTLTKRYFPEIWQVRDQLHGDP